MHRFLLVSYAEIGLKGGNRRQFTERLRDRLRQAVTSADVKASVAIEGSRLAVRPKDEADFDRALSAVLKVPGVAHAAIAYRVERDIDSIAVAALKALETSPAGSFKLEARRGDKSYPLNSIEICRAVGALCNEGSGRPVDVHNPAATVRIVVGRHEAFVTAGTQRGPGGLPVGSTTRLLAMLSGGLDSPVATWKMMRRGARVTGVHFHNRSLQGAAVIEKIEDLCGVLAWAGGKMPLIVVPFEDCQRAIVGTVPAAYRMLVYRRAMFRIAARLARMDHALGYITGDSLGQVASQTAENICTIHGVADLPVYAPLMGSDKVEIVDRARQIGTFDISIRPHDDCCSFLVASNPAVKSTDAEVSELEAGLDWEALVEASVQKAERRVILPDPNAL